MDEAGRRFASRKRRICRPMVMKEIFIYPSQMRIKCLLNKQNQQVRNCGCDFKEVNC